MADGGRLSDSDQALRARVYLGVLRDLLPPPPPGMSYSTDLDPDLPRHAVAYPRVVARERLTLGLVDGRSATFMGEQLACGHTRIAPLPFEGEPPENRRACPLCGGRR